MFLILPPKDLNPIHSTAPLFLSIVCENWANLIVGKKAKWLRNNLILIRLSQPKKRGTEGMRSETKWERTGGRAIDGSSTKGTVRSSSEQRLQNECGWNIAAPITERDGWKRRVEQCHSVPCSEDIFLSVLILPPCFCHTMGFKMRQNKEANDPGGKGIKIWAIYTCSTH